MHFDRYCELANIGDVAGLLSAITAGGIQEALLLAASSPASRLTWFAPEGGSNLPTTTYLLPASCLYRFQGSTTTYLPTYYLHTHLLVPPHLGRIPDAFIHPWTDVSAFLYSVSLATYLLAGWEGRGKQATRVRI